MSTTGIGSASFNPLLAAGKKPFRASAPSTPVSQLEQKISDALAADRETFLRLQAFETRKRITFYQNLGAAGAKGYAAALREGYAVVGRFFDLRGA